MNGISTNKNGTDSSPKCEHQVVGDLAMHGSDLRFEVSGNVKEAELSCKLSKFLRLSQAGEQWFVQESLDARGR